MKFLAGVVVTLAVIGGVLTYPDWRGPVVEAVPQLNNVLPAPASTPAATLPVPAAPTAPGTASTTPVTLAPAPTAVPGPATPGTGLTWTDQDLSWADSTMRHDELLDLAEVALCAAGKDPRYGCPGSASSFQLWASRWGTVVAQVDDIGSQLLLQAPAQTFPSSADLASSENWFAEATSAHQTDIQEYPQNTSWDQQWIAVYARMTALFEAVP